MITTRLYLFIVLLNLSGYAQTITGNVQEADKKMLTLVNVLLLKAKDSSLVKGTITDTSGNYTISNVRPGTYVLRASRIGYSQGYSLPFTINAEKSELVMPVLILSVQSGQLNEVTVAAKRPFLEQKIDRTVVNVAGSIIASGSTALDILEKAPGVTIDRQNDQISLRGKEGVIVQIDGRQTYLSMADVVAMLKSMSSDNIDRIELITNPSARYDAAGNAGIIDIRLKKNNNLGTNGLLSVSAGSGRYHREQASLQINHRTSKINLFGNFSANLGGNYSDFDVRRTQADGAQRNFINSSSYIIFKNSSQNTKAGLDYFVNKTTTMGLVWTGSWNEIGERSPAHVFFRREETGPVYLQTLTDKRQSSQASNHVGNFNIQHTFLKKQGQLSADIDAGRFRRYYYNALNTETIIPSIPAEPLTGLYTYMPTFIDILSFRTDFSQSINPSWKMEAGLKSSSVRSDNDVALHSGLSGHLQKDTSLSNHFLYTERVNAAYATFSGKLDVKTNLMLGLRAEHTHSVGNSLTFKHVVDRKYLNLFPSVFLSRAVTRSHTVTFSYSYRIDRPNYQNLNPARSYLDPYRYTAGNPFLKPQYTHSVELKHGFKNKVFTSLAASYVSDLVFFVIQPIDSRLSERMPENIGKSQAYSLVISFPVAVCKGWTIQSTLMGNYSQFQYTYKSSPLSVQQISGRLNAANAILLGKGWTAELTGWLNTPAVRALQHSPWLGSIDAGIQKSIGSRWKASVSVQDVLHTNYTRFRIEAPDFYNTVWIRLDSRVAMFKLTYAFGNQQLKNARQRKLGSEEEIQRTN
ncbi:TonB-dependent receptor [Segetibacter sp. 3557_3]|uniref:outer membrane beta-barrel protein n=1 Tax=Segetibacter sp. 3557_3 TaxID=2547429 RepID=UPI001058495D|nr:outer membrane beta-barrel protein [Segetibacter sp. 3557_3]TDH23971.1 TonB-dependent receptor [Segetibacter sp. 3557_3]